MDYILRIRNVNIFKKARILTDINFDLKRGKILTIVGPNGSGKTTLAKIILNLVKPDTGEVILAKDTKIGYMPQKIIFDRLMPLNVKNFLQLNSYTDNTALLSVIDELNIKNIQNSQISNLSGGELQKVMFARALLKQPNLLVLDEPTQGIDVSGQVEFYKLIDRIRLEKKISVLMISHDLYMVMKSTDYVLCLNKHICCEGTPEDVSKHPEYINLFGKETAKTISVYPHHHDHYHNL